MFAAIVEALDIRDAIARALYDNMFDYLVQRSNELLRTKATEYVKILYSYCLITCSMIHSLLLCRLGYGFLWIRWHAQFQLSKSWYQLIAGETHAALVSWIFLASNAFPRMGQFLFCFFQFIIIVIIILYRRHHFCLSIYDDHIHDFCWALETWFQVHTFLIEL